MAALVSAGFDSVMLNKMRLHDLDWTSRFSWRFCIAKRASFMEIFSVRRASFSFFTVSNSVRTSVNLVSSVLTLAAMFAFSVRISVSIAITLLMPEGSSASRTGGPSGVLGLLSGLARLVPNSISILCECECECASAREEVWKWRQYREPDIT